MMKNRLAMFSVMMIALMAASEFFLAGRTNIKMMPAVLVVYVVLTLVFNTRKDHLFNIMIAYGMSHFHFATKAGMLGPWLILSYLILQGQSFVTAKYHSRNASLVLSIIVFVFLNLLGLMIKNPNGLFENTSNFISLIGLVLVLIATSNHEISKADLQFVIYVFGIMTIYTSFSAINTGLGFIRTRSPLLTLNELYYDSNFGVAMFGRSYSEYFLCMNILFANMMIANSWILYSIKKNLIVIFYLSSFLGCLLGFSKTMTFLLLVGNAVVFAKARIYTNVKSMIGVVLGITLVGSMVVFVQKFFNLAYIFERFQQQPELFKRVLESPLKAEGTSRGDSFYWGWRRNLDFNWLVGYGWSPADGNHAAYFHGLTININKQDFHNLYLSLSPVFGWIGSIIFMSWLFSALYRSYRMSIVRHDLYFKTIGTGFLGMLIVFLLGEYAVPITSEPNYLFVLFVWIGLANSLYHNSVITRNSQSIVDKM